MAIFSSDIKSSLKDEFLRAISHGLQRKSITSCSKWASAHRIMYNKETNLYEKWSFRDFPWLRDMHDSQADMNIGQKSSQMGFTETVLNITFYKIDIEGVDCLYVLPAKNPDAGDFSAARFDAALELSPHLEGLFSDTKNIGHKRAGSANLYIRGSKSRSGLKSIPCGFICLDEVNEMPRKNITLALERASGQTVKRSWLISTPTVEDFGISIYYKRSSQNIFYFRCPSCSRFTHLSYPDSLIIEGEFLDDPKVKGSHLICNLCKNELKHEEKYIFLNNSKWIESYSNRDIKGWHISHLYSTKIQPFEIAQAYFASLQDSTEEQEFYNSKLGLTHEAKDARLTDALIEGVRSTTFLKKDSAYDGFLTLGVDPGYPFIHYSVVQWIIPEYPISSDMNILAKARLISYGKVKEFEELDQIMYDFQIRYAVCDAHPERRKAYEFSTRFYGRVRLAFYSNGITGKQIHISDLEEPTLSVDRTSWIDLTLGRFRAKTISVPADIDHEYCEHLKAQVRITKKDTNGNPVNQYVNTKADHYAHSLTYAEIALPLAASLSQSQSLGNVL